MQLWMFCLSIGNRILFLLWARLPTPVPDFVFGGVKVAFLDATLRCGFCLGNNYYLVDGKVGRASAH